MAQRLLDGSFRMSDGRIVYVNTVLQAGDLEELLKAIKEAQEEIARKHAAITAELARREEILVESRFRDQDGHVYNFNLVKGRYSGVFWVGQTGDPVSVAAMLYPKEVERARKHLGIKADSPAEIWFDACLRAIKDTGGRLERHLGSNKFHMRPNRKTVKSRMRIGKPKGNYPRGSGR